MSPADPGPREVGGLWCDEVLERLADYLAGELSAEERAKVDAHLRGCDWCAHFGGEYGQVVDMLRSTLGPPPADPAVAERLAERLEKELD